MEELKDKLEKLGSQFQGTLLHASTTDRGRSRQEPCPEAAAKSRLNVLLSTILNVRLSGTQVPKVPKVVVPKVVVPVRYAEREGMIRVSLG